MVIDVNVFNVTFAMTALIVSPERGGDALLAYGG